MLHRANQIIEAKEPFAVEYLTEQEAKIDGIVLELLGMSKDVVNRQNTQTESE